MAALPKRKPSTRRQGKRRRHQKIVAPQAAICPECGGAKLPHYICPHCGFWGKKSVNEKKQKAKN